MTKENKVKEKILKALENLGRTTPEYMTMDVEDLEEKKKEE